MENKELAPLALRLRERGQELKQAGTLAQMQHGPKLIEDTADLLVEVCARLDALTPYADEVAE
jgi:hypothetical protein